MVALILSSIYTPLFYSLLIAPHFCTPIDTKEDLDRAITNPNWQARVYADNTSFIAYQLRRAALEAEHPLFSHLARHLNQTHGWTRHIGDKYIRLVEENPRGIAIGARISLVSNRLLYATIPLHIGSEGLNQQISGIITRKRSPLYPPVKMV